VIADASARTPGSDREGPRAAQSRGQSPHQDAAGQGGDRAQGRRILGRFKVAKHFRLGIEDGRFSWARRQDAIARESALDGIYVIRTSQPQEQLSAADAVRKYKSLALVERAFRCFKGRSAGAARPPSQREPRARSRVSLHAGLLRGMAHARGTLAAAVS